MGGKSEHLPEQMCIRDRQQVVGGNDAIGLQSHELLDKGKGAFLLVHGVGTFQNFVEDDEKDVYKRQSLFQELISRMTDKTGGLVMFLIELVVLLLSLIHIFKALETKWITGRQIEAARIAVTRYMQRQGQIWIRIFPDKPITRKRCV